MLKPKENDTLILHAFKGEKPPSISSNNSNNILLRVQKKRILKCIIHIMLVISVVKIASLLLPNTLRPSFSLWFLIFQTLTLSFYFVFSGI